MTVSHESAGDSARVRLIVTNIVLSMARACAAKLPGDHLGSAEVIIQTECPGALNLRCDPSGLFFWSKS